MIIASGQQLNTYSVQDENGNPADNAVVVYTGGDNQAPSWTTTPGNLNRTVECGNAAALDAAQALLPEAKDNCSGVTITKTSGLLAPSCGATGTYTNTFVAMDASNNTGTTFTQVITVQDNFPPEFSSHPDEIRNADDNCRYYAVGTEFDITATDQCSSNLTYSFSVYNVELNMSTRADRATLAGVVFYKGSNTVYWTVKDACNNSRIIEFHVTVIDNQDGPGRCRSQCRCRFMYGKRLGIRRACNTR